MENDRSKDCNDVVDAAMGHFWHHGYEASSMRELLSVTGSNRATIYADFGGKAGLFNACLQTYQDAVVTPALAQVEADGAGLAEIAAYFEHQISRAEQVGLPGPGCFIANTMVELSPHDDAVRVRVAHHLERLSVAFANALSTAADGRLTSDEIDELADFLAISAQGLWSHARQVSNAAPLRAYARQLTAVIEDRLSR